MFVEYFTEENYCSDLLLVSLDDVALVYCVMGWPGGAIMLGKLPVPGVLLIWIRVGQGPTALAVSAGGGCFGLFSLAYHFSFLIPFLWEAVRYILKYCLKGPLSPKQPTSQ